MTTALDTNVIVALWDADDALHRAARHALETAWAAGRLVISPVVYAELAAAPRRSGAFVDRFCEDTGICIEWELQERVWRTAATAFQGYVTRRKKELGGATPRRLLADFLIGAHALENGYTLLTADSGVYRASFPRLRLSAF